MIGETLGQYRIDARLGAGGMGVVYRAHDDRLHRIVALKLLGGEGRETGPNERDKLLDEARAASHLNHPHICTVYEVGEIGGRAFIAMEFVEGESLAQLIPSDGMPAETVVRYGVQIAAALAHAHERGVVHRDLKTANVAVNPASGTKVLDFGLARRVGASAVDGATHSVRTIEPGVLVGTLPYVAPEILGGQGADSRTDIWALGVVLYEMATGQLPFQGRSEYELTASILRSPPQPFPAHVPAILRAIVLRCLAKEPGQRYQRAGEVRAALEAIHSDLVIAPAAPSHRSGRALLAVAGAVALALALAIVWMTTRPTPPASAPTDAALTTRGRLSRVVSSSLRAFDPAISPDGRMIAYVAENPAGRFDVYTTRVAGGAHLRLTDDATRELLPRFSPDGERVAFTAVDAASSPTIRIVPALGGPAVATIPAAGDAAWSPDGRRLVYVGRDADGRSQLVVSAADGSDPRIILRTDARYPFLRHPTWSPDAATIAVVRGTGGIAGEIWLLPAAGGVERLAIREPESVFADWPSFSADGQRLVHASNRGGATNIWSLPLTGGAPVQLTTGAGPDESPSISRDGTVAYVNSRWHNTLEIHDLRRGTQRTLLTHSPYIWAPDISPDGREITFSRNDVDGAWHLWTASIDDGAVRQLTSGQNGEVYPRYTRDGSAITFHSWNAPRRIGRVAPAGGPVTWLLEGAPAGETFADTSPDGRWLAFVRTDADAERIYVANTDGTGVRRLTPGRSTLPRWSPDGSRIAFAGDRRYSAGIFVINADGTGVRQVSKEGGWPVWWPDGRSVGFLVVGADGHARIRVVSLNDGAARMLDSVRLDGSNHPFAITRDGHRIVVGNAVHDADEIWVLGR